MLSPAPGMTSATLTAFLRPEPAVNRGTRLAAMVMLSPVRGLRPSRAPRSATWNFPKPVKLTSSPSLSDVSIVLMTALTAPSASFLDRPLVDATLSTNSDFVMSSSFAVAGVSFPRWIVELREANSASGRCRAGF